MTSNQNELNYRKILLRELEIRTAKNPSFNLSSFARLLEIPSSRLSEILRQKVGISSTKAFKVATILRLSEKETDLFLDLVRVEHSRNSREREEAKIRIKKSQDSYTQYPEEELQEITDWYYHVLIEFINLHPGKTKLEMSRSLAIDIPTIDRALKRLIALKIITKGQKGYGLTQNNRTTSTDIPSESIKKLNEQVLTKAKSEIRKQSVDNRDYSILILSFNKAQMKLAKERLKDFRRSFMKEFENSINKDSVYCMSIQLFEMTGNDGRG